VSGELRRRVRGGGVGVGRPCSSSHQLPDLVTRARPNWEFSERMTSSCRCFKSFKHTTNYDILTTLSASTITRHLVLVFLVLDNLGTTKIRPGSREKLIEKLAYFNCTTPVKVKGFQNLLFFRDPLVCTNPTFLKISTFPTWPALTKFYD